jgi:hypothetical protein
VSSNSLLQKKINITNFVYYENQGLLCETSNIWQNTNSTLKILCSNQNSKLKNSMIQFRFFNIHINHKTQLAMINMLLRGHHIGIYIYMKVMFWTWFDMVFGLLFHIFTPSWIVEWQIFYVHLLRTRHKSWRGKSKWPPPSSYNTLNNYSIANLNIFRLMWVSTSWMHNCSMEQSKKPCQGQKHKVIQQKINEW